MAKRRTSFQDIVSIENEEHENKWPSIWGVDKDDLPSKGVSAYEMIEKIDEGEITRLVSDVFQSNCLQSKCQLCQKGH